MTAVELFDGTTWTVVGTCTALSTNPCQGTFPGYTLTTAQRASTIGVRLTFAPDDALMREIADMDVDALTPLQAITKLYELTERARGAGA